MIEKIIAESVFFYFFFFKSLPIKRWVLTKIIYFAPFFVAMIGELIHCRDKMYKD